jgi:hypothetical protein
LCLRMHDEEDVDKELSVHIPTSSYLHAFFCDILVLYVVLVNDELFSGGYGFKFLAVRIATTSFSSCSWIADNKLSVHCEIRQ